MEGLLAVSPQSMGAPLIQVGGPASTELRVFVDESPNWEPEVRPTSAALARARLVASILDAVAPAFPPHLSPGVGGGLQFELRHSAEDCGRELDIEVLRDGSVGYLVAEGSHCESSDMNPEFLYLQIECLTRWFAARA